MTLGCGLSKSDKNIGAGGWRVDTLFEASDSGDIFAHPRITNIYSYIVFMSTFHEEILYSACQIS